MEITAKLVDKVEKLVLSSKYFADYVKKYGRETVMDSDRYQTAFDSIMDRLSRSHQVRPTDTDTLSICKRAIQDGRGMRFTYDGRIRFVEPFTVGRNHLDNDILRAWHVRGYSERKNIPPWRTYSLDKMKNIRLVKMSFRVKRPDYNPNDQGMQKDIYATMTDFYKE